MFFIYLMTIEDEKERKDIEARYYEHRHQCMYIARKYTNDPYYAEDMVQEAFLKIIEHRKDYLKLSCNEFYGLLVTIIRNIARDGFKKSKPIIVSIDELGENVEGKGLLPDEKAIMKDELETVFAELDKLDEETRLVMQYRSLGLNTATIADMMGLKFKTVEMKIYRTRKKLKAALKGDKIFD